MSVLSKGLDTDVLHVTGVALAGWISISVSLRSSHFHRRSSTDLIVAAAGFIKVLREGGLEELRSAASYEGWDSGAITRLVASMNVAWQVRTYHVVLSNGRRDECNNALLAS